MGAYIGPTSNGIRALFGDHRDNIVWAHRARDYINDINISIWLTFDNCWGFAPAHGDGCGRGSLPPVEGARGCYPRKFFLRFLVPNPAFGGNLGQKIN